MMKTIILTLICLISLTTFSQDWFDKNCKNIDDDVAVETFKSSQPRNILKVVINQAGVVVINDEEKPNISEIAFKEWVLKFITNPNNDKDKAENPDKVYVQLKSFNKNSESIENIETYIQDVYLYLWDNYASEKYNSTYIDLNCKKRAKVFDKFPLKIVADFENESDKNGPPTNFGIPPFEGDVKDN